MKKEQNLQEPHKQALNIPVVRQRYIKNCIGCGKFVKKNRWVIIDENETIDGGALCAECEGNIERTSLW